MRRGQLTRSAGWRSCCCSHRIHEQETSVLFCLHASGPERGQQAADKIFGGVWLLDPAAAPSAPALARVLCTFVPDTRREAREALLFVHFPTMKRDRHIEERRAKWERETVPKGTLRPMNLATVRPGCPGRGTPPTSPRSPNRRGSFQPSPRCRRIGSKHAARRA